MSLPSEPSSISMGAPQPSVDATTISSIVPQTLTVFPPTILSTAIVSQSTGGASAVSAGASQTTSSTSNLNSNPSASGIDSDANQSGGGGGGGDRTTVIILASVLSIVGCLLIGGAVWMFLRCRRRRSKLFTRGITPIGDDEIETWKGHRTEKGHTIDDGTPPYSSPQHQHQHHQLQQTRTDERGHQKSESTTSVKKPPSVIVYARKSEENSPRSPPMAGYAFSKMSFDGGKRSLDKELPFTPIQARAPNAREGLTDEAIPGDEPFVHSPKRRGSRLSKVPRYPHQSHARNKSSRSSSSLHRLGDRAYGYESDDYRPSHDDFYPGHSRVSSSEDPPRLSLSDDWPAGFGGLSPRPLIVRAEDIGRAIG